MSLNAFLQFISGTALAQAISQQPLTFPLLECLHVVAISGGVGTIAIVDLHLLGYRSHRRSARQLIREVLPYTWTSFGIAAVVGLLLFISKAPTYAHNTHFQWKLVLIALAAANMALFHLTIYQRVEQWDEHVSPPRPARVAAATSLCLWIGVIFFGRWVGFTT